MRWIIFLIAVIGVNAQILRPILAGPAPAAAASISRDGAGATIAPFTGVTSKTQSYTVGSGTNRALFVSVWSDIASGGPGFSGITYAGSAMTVVQTIFQTGTTRPLTLLYLAAPSSGANNLVLSGLNSGQNYQAEIVSYSGASQSAPTNIVTDNTALTTSLTLTLTTAQNNSWLVGTFMNLSGDAQTAGSNTTVVQQVNGSSVTDSNAAQTPTGSHVQAVTGDFQIYGIAIELQHA